MTNSDSLNLSKEQVLQTTIEILRSHDDEASLDTLYEEFAGRFGRPLDETEAASFKEIIDASNADQCLIQPDGTCRYINTADNQNYHLEINTDKAGKADAADNSVSMKEALETETFTEEYTTVPTDEATAVIEPVQLADADSKEGKADQKFPDGTADLSADATAYAEEAMAAADQTHTDHKIERQDRHIDRLNEKIERENDKIDKHEAQIAKDKSKLMKDLHEKEIHHDEKSIDRAENKIDKLEQKIVHEH